MKRVVIVVALVALAVFGATVYAVADTAVYGPSGGPESGTVTVNATVNPRLRLTIETPGATQTVNFGNVDPGTPYSQDVTVTAMANRAFDLTSTVTGDVALLGFTHNLANQNEAGPGSIGYVDNYAINVPWTTPSLVTPYVVSVQYTLFID